jgi:hypothetical protein
VLRIDMPCCSLCALRSASGCLIMLLVHAESFEVRSRQWYPTGTEHPFVRPSRGPYPYRMHLTPALSFILETEVHFFVTAFTRPPPPGLPQVFPYIRRSAYQELDEHPDGLPGPLLKLLVWQLLQALVYLHRRKVCFA